MTNATADLVIAQPPVGKPVIGTIIFGSGMGGTGLYGTAGSYEAGMMENLRNAGYRIIERVWTNGPNGWFTGTLGPAVSACRYATLVNWIRKQYPSGQLCATGVSGGAVEMSFGLSRWGLGNVLNAVVFDSGPQTRLDYYCVGTANPPWSALCQNINSNYSFSCPGTTGCEPYPGVAQLIDESYNGVNTCYGATMQSPNLAKLYTDSADGPGAVLNFPNTRIAFYEGALDCSFGVAISGVAYANEITSLGAAPAVSIISGQGHQISQSSTGSALIENALTSLCTGGGSTTVVVTAAAGANGLLVCASPVALYSSTTCTATPSPGYHTSSVSGCNGTWSGGNSYTTGTITGPCTVSSTFAPDQYAMPSITITKPGVNEPVDYGSSYTIQWTASDPDSSAVITLGYDTVGSGCNGNQIATGIQEHDGPDSHAWDMTGLQPATYYIYGIISDGTNTRCAYGGGPLIKGSSSGDMNNDGSVDIADALYALRISAGLISPTLNDLSRGDVAPLVNGVPKPDGKIDVGDVVVIMRKAVGLTTW